MTDQQESARGIARIGKLAVAVVAMAALWLGVLPALTRTPAAARHIRTMQEGRVNPGAMFYSELEGAGAVSIPLDTKPTPWKQAEAPAG
jgi:hypothetical protein